LNFIRPISEGVFQPDTASTRGLSDLRWPHQLRKKLERLRRNQMHILNGKTLKKILIIEDDQKVALGLAIRIKAGGFETVIAHDALSGVRSAIKVKPDLVLLDISMPAGNGFIVAERIQKNISTPIPIIFLTASKREDFRERASELGAVAFFEKPYDAQELLAVMREALGVWNC
jgi:CheY-like chemotaxis protein